MNNDDLICLDAEFANGVEMLELSIINGDEMEVYSSRLKPATLKNWSDSFVHGITPEMVKDAPKFSECRKDIQKIIDHSKYIVGFAVEENDLSKLQREGIIGIEKKRILEVRDWFWICYGLPNGMDYSQNVGLQSCCESLEIENDSDKAHSSLYDTQVTLKVFKRLFSHFRDKYVTNEDSFEKIVNEFKAIFAREKEEYDRKRLKGFCTIIKKGEGYAMKFTKTPPNPENEIVASIEVENKKKAMIYFSQLFTNEIRDGNFLFQRLSAKKLAKFKEYNDVFNAEDVALDNKLFKLAAKFRK